MLPDFFFLKRTPLDSVSQFLIAWVVSEHTGNGRGQPHGTQELRVACRGGPPHAGGGLRLPRQQRRHMRLLRQIFRGLGSVGHISIAYFSLKILGEEKGLFLAQWMREGGG